MLGRRPDRVLSHMATNKPAAFDVAMGPAMLQGVLVEIHESSGLATHIERIDTAAE